MSPFVLSQISLRLLSSNQWKALSSLLLLDSLESRGVSLAPDREISHTLTLKRAKRRVFMDLQQE